MKEEKEIREELEKTFKFFIETVPPPLPSIEDMRGLKFELESYTDAESLTKAINDAVSKLVQTSEEANRLALILMVGLSQILGEVDHDIGVMRDIKLATLSYKHGFVMALRWALTAVELGKFEIKKQ